MGGNPRVRIARDAADIGALTRGLINADRNLSERRVVHRCGNRVQHLTRQHELGLRILHVDHGAGAGNSERFLQPADLQICIHRQRHACVQVEALALDSGESGQRKGHAIAARAEVLDAILTLRVGGRAAYFFDERRARHFHRYAGQDRTGRIFDRSRNCTRLSPRRSR